LSFAIDGLENEENAGVRPIAFLDLGVATEELAAIDNIRNRADAFRMPRRAGGRLSD